MANRFLDAYDAFLLDIDGVIVRGSEPIPGAAATLEALRSQGHVILLTNNSTRTRAQHAERLGRAGLEVNPEMVLSSSYLAARHLHETYGLLTVFVVGEDGLREELRDAGHTVTAEPDAEAVVVGMDRDLTYAALRDGLTALEGGARLVATNDDATFPTPTGPLPGAGAIVGAFRGMGFEPEAVIGKPSSTAFEIALGQLDVPRNRTLMIGDRLETDILGGYNAGIDTALVLSGIATVDDLEAHAFRPTWIADDLEALAQGEIQSVPA